MEPRKKKFISKPIIKISMEKYSVTTTYVKQLWLHISMLRGQTYKSAEEREHLNNIQVEYRNLIELISNCCLYQKSTTKSVYKSRAKKPEWFINWKPTVVYQNKNK